MCNISLSSPLSCGFPLGPGALLHRAYSSTTSLCVHLSELLSFAFRVCVCVVVCECVWVCVCIKAQTPEQHRDIPLA